MKYTSERNHQILIELLKHHNIKKIVTSPGGTNVTFVASVQQDPFFELYSSVDERSAAYIACGLAEESNEPVVLSCTGATAARNYFSGLTEAYYRKLPILAITSTMPVERVGHNFAQATDRTVVSNDIAKHSVLAPIVKDAEDEWNCSVKCNEAILELKHNGRGPVHINLETTGADFDASSIKPVQFIDRICHKDKMPEIKGKKIAIFVGAHSKWSEQLTKAVDDFCEKYNAVVIYDHTSNYKGKYGVLGSLITSQKFYKPICTEMDILVHIGNISGSYINLLPKETWRVNVDGKICDNFKKLRFMFEMEEAEFFNRYNNLYEGCKNIEYYKEWKKEYEKLINKIGEIPFSNIWVAKNLSTKLPKNSTLHLGILNSLRSWNFFEIDKTIDAYANTGGFGIDGCVSSLLGAALASPQKLFFGIVGDLAFFYDMNAVGNRDFARNIRLIVINNGGGQEFKNYGSRASQFGEGTNSYIAAMGHFGYKSVNLIKSYVEALGIKYLSANTKEEFSNNLPVFLSENNDNTAIIFEVFTNTEEETEALKMMYTIEESISENAKQIVKNVLGEKRIRAIKSLLKE